MSSRDARRSGHETGRGERTTSVVGSRVSDATGGVWGSRLPRGGIRDGGLEFADGVSDSGRGSGGRDERTGRSVLRIIAIVSGSLALLLVLLAGATAVLSNTGAFPITSVQSYDTEHVSAETIAQLAAVPEGSTLLNLDEQTISENVRKNPWVASVLCERAFPDTLRIIVTERVPTALVSMGTGGLAWLLGEDGVWIEPVRVEVGGDESMNDAALREAESGGLLLIIDVPQTVSPVAGCLATDEAIKAVWTYREQLSKPFLDEVVAFSASSENDISCILRSGVEVSFGSSSNIDTKESVAREVLEAYAGQVTYINVRVPQRPTYRRVNSDYVREGTGATGTIIETLEEPTEEDAQAKEGDEKTAENAQSSETPAEGSQESQESQTQDADEYGEEGAYGSEGYDAYGYDSGYGYEEYDSSGYDDYGYSDYGTDDTGYGTDEAYGTGEEYGTDEGYGYY